MDVIAAGWGALKSEGAAVSFSHLDLDNSRLYGIHMDHVLLLRFDPLVFYILSTKMRCFINIFAGNDLARGQTEDPQWKVLSK